MTHASEPALTVGCPACAPCVLDAGEMKLILRFREPTDSERLVHRAKFVLAKEKAIRHFYRCIAKENAVRRAKKAHSVYNPVNDFGPECEAIARQRKAYRAAHRAALRALRAASCKVEELADSGACEACVSA